MRTGRSVRLNVGDDMRWVFLAMLSVSLLLFGCMDTGQKLAAGGPGASDSSSQSTIMTPPPLSVPSDPVGYNEPVSPVTEQPVLTADDQPPALPE